MEVLDPIVPFIDEDGVSFLEVVLQDVLGVGDAPFGRCHKGHRVDENSVAEHSHGVAVEAAHARSSHLDVHLLADPSSVLDEGFSAPLHPEEPLERAVAELVEEVLAEVTHPCRMQGLDHAQRDLAPAFDCHQRRRLRGTSRRRGEVDADLEALQKTPLLRALSLAPLAQRAHLVTSLPVMRSLLPRGCPGDRGLGIGVPYEEELVDPDA